jgi:hypothetical protein
MSKHRVAFGLNALADYLGTSKQNLYQLVAKHQPPHSVEIQAGNKTIKGYDKDVLKEWYDNLPGRITTATKAGNKTYQAKA